MPSSDLIRWSGDVGRHAVGDRCLRPMRESGALDGILMFLSLLLFAVGVAGLVILARSAGRFRKAGKTGIIIGAVGAMLLVIPSLVQAIIFGGDFPLMPNFVIPGLLALVVGFVLLGIAILRARVLPRWATALLIVGALAMLGSNEQTARVLLMIPFGVAWVAVGYVLWSDKGAMPQRPARVKPRPGRRYTYPLPEWQKNARNPTRFGTSEETSAGRNAAKPRHEGLNLYAVL